MPLPSGGPLRTNPKIQIRTLVSKASDAALARFFGGADVDLLGLSEALERVGRDGERSSQTARSEGRSQDEKELVLTLADLEEGEKRLPPPASTMKMGCPKIPQVGPGRHGPGTRGVGVRRAIQRFGEVKLMIPVIGPPQ